MEFLTPDSFDDSLFDCAQFDALTGPANFDRQDLMGGDVAEFVSALTGLPAEQQGEDQ